MTELEIIRRWEEEYKLYELWGKHIASILKPEISRHCAPTAYIEFLKVPVIPRLKSLDSLIAKALYRGKDYESPYDEITDKIGIRYVVLLTSDISKVEAAITSLDAWDAEKCRDFNEDRVAKPLQFAYQSVHFVLRNKRSFEFEGLTIPQHLPCEVQVRTLLQHAHSELTHDLIYKAKQPTLPHTHRTAAKSMALIEVVDEFFESVARDILSLTAVERTVVDILSNTYRDALEMEPNVTRATTEIVQTYIDQLSEDLRPRIESLLAEKGYIVHKIKECAEFASLYRQPGILSMYLLANETPVRMKQQWPFSDEELRTVYQHLGHSFDDM